ncbi:bifunctional chorismate mutase/prephenate dehydrogenase [Pseudidiomarina andamanensis]|uniref:T-protein n=1 Tax=Pseudidiomarina andamanensis TaxID=1940690 RepID=A0AA92ILJ9_9GAMM|nr:bifunctional chorismate mutase/prephenate dehydrogenase [Pseudidiomarina andamanensis]MDS0218703.1 bifunctional chorismate mutase/prephenate dehydrogenase [Pseudidiomarina andamanensis]QGT95565.1 bifunctional chorismate mutase/prephenate dehydrogenase [Pseudidiomarina andamanensis]
MSNSKHEQQQLEALRQQIDDTDSELVRLLLQRRQLASQVGVVKRKLGQPLFVPEREAAMLANRREQAQQMGLSPELIEDVLRRVIRESYQQQQAADVHLERKSVVIVGGAGALGRLFVRLFESAGATVNIIEKDNWEMAEVYCAQADLVLIAVPVIATVDVIAELPVLPPSCVLADVTSIKEKPLAAMMAKHSGPVLGLHPMFGPQQVTLAKQLMVACHGRDEENYQWLLQSIERWGAQIKFIDAAEHDQAMSFVQVLRHLSTFVYGAHLAQEQVDVQQLLDLSSPIYRLELMMVGRLFAQDANLYADIILSEPRNFMMLRRYVRLFEQLLTDLENGEKSQFTDRFEHVRDYFGDFAGKFLTESQRLLDVAGDAKQVS